MYSGVHLLSTRSFLRGTTHPPSLTHTSEARLLIYPPPRLNVKYLSNLVPACTVETPRLWNGR